MYMLTPYFLLNIVASLKNVKLLLLNALLMHVLSKALLENIAYLI